MALIGKAKFDAVNKSFRSLFFSALEKGGGPLADLAMPFFLEVNSSGPEESYNWLGDVPAMSEWTDERKFKALRQAEFAIKNKNWESSVIMSADDVEDDRLGMIPQRVNQLVQSYQRHIFNRFLYLVENATALTCYDSSYFFAADHSEGSSGTQANYHATGALSTTTFGTYRALMQEYKNDQGELLGIMPTHLWGGTTLENTIREICLADRLNDGDSNMYKGLCQPLIIPGLASSTMWGLADLSKPLKPFIKQTRRPVNFVALTDPESPDFFNSRTIKYGADYRGNYGVGFWQTMYMNAGGT